MTFTPAPLRDQPAVLFSTTTVGAMISCDARRGLRTVFIVVAAALLTLPDAALGQARERTLAETLSSAENDQSFVRVSGGAGVITGRIALRERVYVGRKGVDTAAIQLIEHRLPTSRSASPALRGAVLGAAAGGLSVLVNSFREIRCNTTCLVYRVGGGAVVGSIVGHGIGLSRSKDHWEIVWRRP